MRLFLQNKEGKVHNHVVSELFNQNNAQQQQPTSSHALTSSSSAAFVPSYAPRPTYFAVREGCTSSRALKMMTQRNLGALLVTDGNQPTGIVTEVSESMLTFADVSKCEMCCEHAAVCV